MHLISNIYLCFKVAGVEFDIARLEQYLSKEDLRQVLESILSKLLNNGKEAKWQRSLNMMNGLRALHNCKLFNASASSKLQIYQLLDYYYPWTTRYFSSSPYIIEPLDTNHYC